jgi:hypothetical protein
LVQIPPPKEKNFVRPLGCYGMTPHLSVFHELLCL